MVGISTDELSTIFRSADIYVLGCGTGVFTQQWVAVTGRNPAAVNSRLPRANSAARCRDEKRVQRPKRRTEHKAKKLSNGAIEELFYVSSSLCSTPLSEQRTEVIIELR